jgi:hypothetical protein
MQNTQGLNSPDEVYFFSKKPEEYGLGDRYYSYEIEKATEQTLATAKRKVVSSTKFEMIQFAEPTVDVQGKKYIYVVRSYASRGDFQKVMSPQYLFEAKGVGILGLHYHGVEAHGDAIGITVEADTPEAAKGRFQAWHASIKEALKTLADRFAILNREVEEKVEELAAKRLEELSRAKNAL